MVKVKLKRPVEVPAPIQQAINSVLSVPLDHIGQALGDFKWTFDKVCGLCRGSRKSAWHGEGS